MLGFQNFFSTELSSGITATDTTIPVNSLPDPSEGYLVIEPDSGGNREIIYYTSKTSNAVICPSVAAGRGVGGTSARSHNTNSTVKMNIAAEHFLALQLSRHIQYNAVAATETRASATFGDLATVGPSVNVEISKSGLLLIMWSASMNNSASGNFTSAAPALSGANTLAAGASGENVMSFKSESNAGDKQFMQFAYLSGLVEGTTTVTLQYAATGGTGTFSSRKLLALPLL